MAREVIVARPRPNTGSQVVGTTVIQLRPSDRQLAEGVSIICAPGNSGVVYVGNRPNLTAGSTPETDGIAVPGGASVFFPCLTENEIYLVATTANNSITFLSY